MLRQSGAALYSNGEWRRRVNGKPLKLPENTLWAILVDA
jgi:hypothetical protein